MQIRFMQRSRTTMHPEKSSFELEFLPAHVELLETPPHPAALWTARTIGLALIAVVALFAFGQLDIVAAAPGQVIPVASVKVIQPALTGVVRDIHVRNGDRVVADQVLIELDPTQSGADLDKARGTRLDAGLKIARAQALLQAQKRGQVPSLEGVSDADPQKMADSRNLVAGTYGEYQRKLGALQSELVKREAALSTAQAEIEKLETTLPLVEQQARDYKDLVQKKYVATHEYLDRQRLAIEHRQELAAQESRARESQAGIEAQKHEIEGLTASFRREQLEAINQADIVLSQSRPDETKAEARNALTQIRSPVSGIVQQLGIHTVGGVVAAGQALLEVVPDEDLQIEARVSNKDIGFVDAGQLAAVKVTAFPYTRYGYLQGRVEKVSNSATFDKKAGTFFLSRISIPSNSIMVDGKPINLAPGMEVMAEIKTGQRAVWRYFLSPLIETGTESLRER